MERLAVCFSTWKEKHLDYEIETKAALDRLSVPAEHLKRKASRLRDWNYKGLAVSSQIQTTWKEKHLDYEIETLSVSGFVF